LVGSIPFKPDPDLWSSLWPMLVALAVLALLGIAAVLVSRRLGWNAAARPGRRLRVVERLPLSRQSALLLVECDGHTLLVGQAGASIRLIARVASAEDPRAR
jgi:flagellar biogenesis protein FliO